MSRKDFHVPFFKELALIVIFTLLLSFSTRYYINYYQNDQIISGKNTEYSAHKTQIAPSAP